VIAVAFVIPVLATATATPASADSVIDGCTVVSNPTPTHFTDCPNWNSSGAHLDGLNLANADLAGAVFDQCTQPEFGVTPTCENSDFVNANLSSANLAGASFGLCAVAPPGGHVGCGFSDLTDANLTDANLTNTNFGTDNSTIGLDVAGATLTGANFTGTILVPSNQTVTATSQAGAVATWTTPTPLPAATPGTCTPASGSSFPLFSSTVTCQVLDANNDVATGTFSVNVAPTTQFFTRLLIPSNGASLSGTSILDAEAADAPGVTSVVFELSGGSLNDQVVATGTSTIYGWLAQWNSTTVPNGTYSLVSVATDKDKDTDTSTPVSITVNNPLPTTSILIPSTGATLSGSTYLDASASNATAVKFLLFGGSYGYAAPVICTATATLYGWLCAWNTTTVPNNSYVLVSEASNSAGNEFSSGVSITVKN
jgi:Bacterial Ig domain/Pentapeptide repeats (8 copies)